MNKPMIFVKMYFDSEKDDTIAVTPLVDFRFSKIFQIENFWNHTYFYSVPGLL